MFDMFADVQFNLPVTEKHCTIDYNKYSILVNEKQYSFAFKDYDLSIDPSNPSLIWVHASSVVSEPEITDELLKNIFRFSAFGLFLSTKNRDLHAVRLTRCSFVSDNGTIVTVPEKVCMRTTFSKQKDESLSI